METLNSTNICAQLNNHLSFQTHSLPASDVRCTIRIKLEMEVRIHIIDAESFNCFDVNSLSGRPCRGSKIIGFERLCIFDISALCTKSHHAAHYYWRAVY